MTDAHGDHDPTQAGLGGAGAPLPPPAAAGGLPAQSDDMVLPSDVQRALSPTALSALSKMTDQQRMNFIHAYNQQKKSTGLMLALAILFPIQLLLLGETGLGIVFLLTGGGCTVWYVVEWFLTPGRVRKFNANLAEEQIMRMKAMQG